MAAKFSWPFRIGFVALTLWLGLTLVVALLAVVRVAVLELPPPVLQFFLSNDAINALPAEVRGVIDSLAIALNATLAGFAFLALVVLWRGVRRYQRWAWGSLTGVILFGQIMAFVADRALGSPMLTFNLVFTTVALLGLILTAPRAPRVRQGTKLLDQLC